jgi:hypothetical protein
MLLLLLIMVAMATPTFCQLNATRLALQMTPTALASVANDATAQLRAFVQTHEPLDLPNQTIAVLLTHLDLSALQLRNLTFGSTKPTHNTRSFFY